MIRNHVEQVLNDDDKAKKVVVSYHSLKKSINKDFVKKQGVDFVKRNSDLACVNE